MLKNPSAIDINECRFHYVTVHNYKSFNFNVILPVLCDESLIMLIVHKE